MVGTSEKHLSYSPWSKENRCPGATRGVAKLAGAIRSWRMRIVCRPGRRPRIRTKTSREMVGMSAALKGMLRRRASRLRVPIAAAWVGWASRKSAKSAKDSSAPRRTWISAKRCWRLTSSQSRQTRVHAARVSSLSQPRWSRMLRKSSLGRSRTVRGFRVVAGCILAGWTACERDRDAVGMSDDLPIR